MKSVLIIDDDVKLCTMLREYLKRHEIQLDICHRGEPGLEAAASGQYDIMLLDVMLPDVDGFEVLQRLRMSSDLAILLLTARGHASDRIQGFRLGADDYLAKPFDPEELVARIRAILRRSGAQNSSNSIEASRKISIADLTIDLASRTARYKDVLLDLTDLELSLLESFLQSPGIVLTREDLVIRLFERPFHPLNRSLDMHVCRLRRKLKSVSQNGDPIKTIRSAGYLFSTADM
jgi:two-component system response regulator CpxR